MSSKMIAELDAGKDLVFRRFAEREASLNFTLFLIVFFKWLLYNDFINQKERRKYGKHEKRILGALRAWL